MHIYWFQDTKAGHINQVQALLNVLTKKIQASISVIKCPKSSILSHFLPFSNKNFQNNNLDDLILLIGAGHATYSRMLKAKKILKRTNKVFTVAILKPSSQWDSFELICAPKHDFPLKQKPINVITFVGSLAETSNLKTDKKKGIIALGGTSKHYKFNNNLLINQIAYILSIHSNHIFNIYNSRRTPSEINGEIKKLKNKFSNFEFINYLQCPTPQFQNELQTSDIKFVTPDSINLVYESLSSNGQTYLIKLQNSRFNKLFKNSKIQKSMNELISSNHVGLVDKNVNDNQFNIQHPSKDFKPLKEVEKISSELINLLNK